MVITALINLQYCTIGIIRTDRDLFEGFPSNDHLSAHSRHNQVAKGWHISQSSIEPLIHTEGDQEVRVLNLSVNGQVDRTEFSLSISAHLIAHTRESPYSIMHEEVG
jgi:hypothetical protein